MRSAMCACSSASISLSMRLRRNKLAMRRRTATVGLPSGVAQNGANTLDQLIEAFFGKLQLTAACRGELVILGAAIGLSHRPFGGNPPALLHAMQGGIERALFDLEHLPRGVLDVDHDAIAV